MKSGYAIMGFLPETIMAGEIASGASAPVINPTDRQVGKNTPTNAPSAPERMRSWELYALADWGVIPGNPTLYAEYVLRDEKADKVEGKLLLGDEIAPRWHWGVNLVYEAEISGEDLEHEYATTFGLSYTVLDEKLSIGAEAEASFVDTAEDRGDFSQEVYVGPSIQIRPNASSHLDLAPLFGVTEDAKEAKLFLNFGWEF